MNLGASMTVSLHRLSPLFRVYWATIFFHHPSLFSFSTTQNQLQHLVRVSQGIDVQQVFIIWLEKGQMAVPSHRMTDYTWQLFCETVLYLHTSHVIPVVWYITYCYVIYYTSYCYMIATCLYIYLCNCDLLRQDLVSSSLWMLIS